MKHTGLFIAPELKELELNAEAVLCTSERDGSIEQLEEAYDWSSDMWGRV